MPLPPAGYWTLPTPPVAYISYHENSRGDLAYGAFHYGFLQPETHAIFAGNQWFYVVSRRLFEQYDSKTHRLLISVGPQGFHLPDIAPIPFSADVQYSRNIGRENLVTSPDTVYVVDLSRPSTTKLFTAAPDDPIIDVSTSLDESTYSKASFQNQKLPDRRPFTVVVTRKMFHILQDNQTPIVVPINLSTDKDSVEIARTAGDFSFTYGLDWSVGLSTLDVLTYNQAGKLVSQIHLPKSRNRQIDEPNFEEVGALTLSPPALIASMLLKKSERLETPWYVYALIVVSCIFYIFIALMLLRRRHSESIQLAIWLVIAAALGFTGILLLISMLDFPKLIPCHHCRKRRLVTEDRCPHCGTAAPPPAMEGIEIFENSGTALSMG